MQVRRGVVVGIVGVTAGDTRPSDTKQGVEIGLNRVVLACVLDHDLETLRRLCRLVRF